MGTTSEKLTYLNTTKEKIRDSINLTGANLTSEDTFRSYASKLKKGYIDIINNGIDTLYNNFPKVSGIGSNLSLTPTYEAPIKLNEIQGDTLQDGTPTPDTPVEIQSVTGNQEIKVTGKNLVDFSNLQTNSNTTYTWQNDILEVKATTGTYNRAYIDITSLYKNNPGKTLRFDYNSLDFSQGANPSVHLQIVQNGTNNYVVLVDTDGSITTRTIPYDTSEITQVVLRIVSNNTNTSQASQISITKPILHFGSSATEYEPYKGNTYEVNLGKNLFDKNDITTGLYYYASGTSVSVNWAIAQVKVQPNTNYYLSGNNYNNDTARIVLLDSSKNITHDLGGYKNVHLITTNSNTAYIGLSIANYEGSSDLSSIQLEKGSQATSYSPYFTPIELNKIGDYKDSIKKSTGKNLFDINGTFTGNLIKYNNGFQLIKNSTNRTLNYFPASPISKGTYTLSYKIVSSTLSDITKCVVQVFNSNNTQIATKQFSNDGYITFTTADDITKLYFYINNNEETDTQITLDNIQLEQNNQATTYEPYGKVWYVEKQIGKVVLDGSETQWARWFSTPGVYSCSNLIQTINNATAINCISNYYSNTYSRAYVRDNLGTIDKNIATNGGELIIANKSYTTLSDFKTWLSTHNTTVYTILATPTYTEITNTELIEDLETLYTAKSQEGTTNISITSEDLEMILNVSALEGDA